MAKIWSCVVVLCLLVALVFGGLVPQKERVVVKLKRSSSVGDVISHVREIRSAFESEKNATNGEFVSLLQTGDDDEYGMFKATIHSGFKYMEYHGEVDVGGKTFNMLFDTSTPHTWLPAMSCLTCCPRDEKQAQSPALSNEHPIPLFEQFPDGTWLSGVSQYDTFTIGGSLKVKNLAYFQVLVKGSSVTPVPSYTTQCSDSILGLGFTSRWGAEEMGVDASRVGHSSPSQRLLNANARSLVSFVDRLAQEHTMTEPIFSLYLSDKDTESEIEFGSYNKEHIPKRFNPHELIWVSAVGFPSFHWAFNVPRVCLDDDCIHTQNIPARVSSAVPYIAIPQDLYHRLRFPQERVSNPCTILSTLPTLSFVVVGTPSSPISSPSTSFSLSLCPSDYAISTVAPDSDNPVCDFALVPTKLPVIVLGTPFLRKFYAVFDVEQKRMGFAQTTERCDDGKRAKKPTKSQVLRAAMALQNAGIDPSATGEAEFQAKLREALDEVVQQNSTDAIRLSHHINFLN